MKTFMIVIEGHPISEMYRRVVLPSWKNHNVEFYNAVTPKDLAYKTALKFGKKVTRKNTREFTDTEMAVWYSHYELWCKCLQLRESILILEHDSKLTKPIPDLKKYDSKLLSYVIDENVKRPILAAGSGYYITPKAAAVLIAYAVAMPIVTNSDGHVGYHLNAAKARAQKDFNYIEQISIDGLNTIDHLNPVKHFIGPNYEDFDIPSVYGETIASL